MSSALDMIKSLKFNNRRKPAHIPFSKNKKSYEKGEPILTKVLSHQEKEKLLLQLKENRHLEDKQKIYKIIISFCLTIAVIGTIVFLIQFTFF